MDPASLVTAIAGAQMGQLQTAIAAKMLRMNADSAASVVQLLNAAQQTRRASPMSRRASAGISISACKSGSISV